MDIQSNISKSINYCKKCHKSQRNTYTYYFDIYEKAMRNEHIKAINHYSYTSPVKAKVLNLYNNKKSTSNKNEKVSIETPKEENSLINKENSSFQIHQLIPNTGPAHGGIQVTIHGQGFYDGLYVVYGNCIIETEFIDSNNLTFYLPPNPKCFHYNGRKTVKEDLFVVDLYKSLIAHTEFNTNISDSFNIMIEIIMKIIMSRVGINLNDLSFKKLGNTNFSQLINKNCAELKQQISFGNNNSNIFNIENNYIVNSLKSIQNSISCSFTQQEKAFCSLLNKTKEFIPSFPSFPSFPTFYIPNSRNSINSNPSTIITNNINSSISPVITPVIRINLNPSISLYQPSNNLFSPLSHAQAISFANSNLNLNSNSITNPNLSSSLPVNQYKQQQQQSINPMKTINNNYTNNVTTILEKIKPSSNQSLPTINKVCSNKKLLSNTITTTTTTSTFNLNQEIEDMAVEGDDEMDEDKKDFKCSCHLHNENINVGIIPKSSTLHSYKKSFRERRQEIKRQEETKKREHQKNYLEGKKIEKLLEDCVRKSNEAKPIEPNELIYSSTTTTTTTTINTTTNTTTPTSTTSSTSNSNEKKPSSFSNHSSSTSTSSSSSSKPSITVKITLIHLGIILCMTRLIYYILKYCKLCSRVQQCASEASTKLYDIRDNIKKDGTCYFFSKRNSNNKNENNNNNDNNSSSVMNSSIKNDYEYDDENVNDDDDDDSDDNEENESEYEYEYDYENENENDDKTNSNSFYHKGGMTHGQEMNLLEINSSNSKLNPSSSSPLSSPAFSPSNILTPSSSSNDNLPDHVPSNDTQYTVKSVKTKKRATYLKIIDQGDTIGNTPLHYATIAHSPSLFKMLIEAGANINKENIYGQTVLDLAYSIGDETMVALIEDLMNNGNESREEEEEEEGPLSPNTLVDSGFSSGMNEGLI